MGNESYNDTDCLSMSPILMSPNWKDKKNLPRITEIYDERGRYELSSTPHKLEGSTYFKTTFIGGGKDYGDYLEKVSLHKGKTIIRRLKDSSRRVSKKITVITLDNINIRVSQDLPILIQSIEKSKYILELKDNWDDEGAKAYLKDTWIKAIKFIVNYAELILAHTGKSIIAPNIYHGPDGSIDLLWKHLSFNLLINIPEDATLLGTFYGDDYGSQKIEGSFNPELVKTSLFPFLVNLS